MIKVYVGHLPYGHRLKDVYVGLALVTKKLVNFSFTLELSSEFNSRHLLLRLDNLVLHFGK